MSLQHGQELQKQISTNSFPTTLPYPPHKTITRSPGLHSTCYKCSRILITSLLFLIIKMEVVSLNNFIDISEFTLHGEQEYITIQIAPRKVSLISNHEELSIAEVELTGNVLTPCFYFIEGSDDDEVVSAFDLDYEEELEEMVIEELEGESDMEEEPKFEESTINSDMLDALEKQYQRLLEKQLRENCKNDILSSSTSVSGDRSANKGEDFESERFEDNPGYPFETRRDKVERYLKKRKNRNWNKKISYKCRKEVADSRLRVKGRFITRQQANRLLGINTNGMPVDLIRTLLESKFGKEREQETEDSSDK